VSCEVGISFHRHDRPAVNETSWWNSVRSGEKSFLFLFSVTTLSRRLPLAIRVNERLLAAVGHPEAAFPVSAISRRRPATAAAGKWSFERMSAKGAAVQPKRPGYRRFGSIPAVQVSLQRRWGQRRDQQPGAVRQPSGASVARSLHARTVPPARNDSRAPVIALWSTMDRAAVAAVGSTPAVEAGRTAVEAAAAS
jgi:hypothetical protein